jgi:conjugal transfer pilus assembly protein TraK
MVKNIAYTALAVISINVAAESLPSVPVSVVSTRTPVPAEAQNPTTTPSKTIDGGSEGKAVRQPYEVTNLRTKEVYIAEPGTTMMLKISRYHLNRIVTPFGEPAVDTAAKGTTTQIKDNVVLIATESEAPVTLYIREKGTQDIAISLVLIPSEIPPKEITLELSPAYMTGSMMARPQAKRWEQSLPFAEMITTLFSDIAKGRMPPGYRFIHAAAYPTYIPVYCKQPSLEFSFTNGQILEGHNISVAIGTVKNIGTDSTEFVETGCDAWNVAAVAAWPNVYLKPGQSSEVYVALRNNKEPLERLERPSLVGGGS